jgi:hypothetical protein
MVTRYRLDSQFHCSYLESRGVPVKTREIPGKTREIWVKNARNYLPFISGSRLPVMQLPVAHAHTITSGTPTNNNWMVLLYYYVHICV